jgi:hypothetical protein
MGQGHTDVIPTTNEEFWKKWEPVDWPGLGPSKQMKNEFMTDLERLIIGRIDKDVTNLMLRLETNKAGR